MINAGDLLSMSCEHPELGSRVFEPKSGEDHNVKRGGFMSEDDDGNIGTSGTRIDKLVRYPWSAEPTVIAKDGDYEFLMDLQENPVEADWTFTFANNETRGGKGKPVGEVVLNQQAGTIPVKLAGSGKLEVQ